MFSFHQHPYIVYASSEGAGDSVLLHRLARAFFSRKCIKYQNLMCWLNDYYQTIFMATRGRGKTTELQKKKHSCDPLSYRTRIRV